MLRTAENFRAEMDKKGLKYKNLEELSDGKAVALVGWERDMTQYDMTLFFHEDNRSLTIRIFKLFNVPIDKRLQILEQMNEFNANYRWLKFFIDKDSRASVQMDALINENNSGEVAIELMLRANSIIDKTYSAFMHTIWA